MIYVASSWRNPYQPGIVAALRSEGHEVYDFRRPAGRDDGFHWTEVMPSYSGDAATWGGVSPGEFLVALDHERAAEGFASDFDAMKNCDTCVAVLPCGRSAHLELGWFVGQGRRTAILLEDRVTPELMYLMVDHLAASLDGLLDWLRL